MSRLTCLGSKASAYVEGPINGPSASPCKPLGTCSMETIPAELCSGEALPSSVRDKLAF